MRNLRITKEVTSAVPLDKAVDLAVDDVTGSVLVADAHNLFVLSHDGELQEETFHRSAGSDETIKFIHVVSSPAVCIAGSRSMTTWNMSDGSILDHVTLDSDILAVEWSPDSSIGVVVTSDHSATLINQSLESMALFDLEQEGFGEAELITVGWGKKETQFHGSQGKQAAQAHKTPVTCSSPWDSGAVEVTWRDTGEHFAISWVARCTGARSLRIFSAEGELHATAEPLTGLEEGFHWRPRTHLIASSQRTPRGLDVVFFERNSLRHGEFTLVEAPLSTNLRVCQLAFSREGDVLAVGMTQIQNGVDHMIVRLYTTSNYHWYAKQELRLPTPARFDWCPLEAGRLHMIGRGGVYQQMTWLSEIDRSQDLRWETDPALVAVVDGSRLLLTPMRQLVVPPPMSAYALRLPAQVQRVSLPGPWVDGGGQMPSSTGLVALSDGTLWVVGVGDGRLSEEVRIEMGAAGGNGYNSKCGQLTSAEKLKFNLKDMGAGLLSHVTWISPTRILLVLRDVVFLLEHCEQTWNWKSVGIVPDGVEAMCYGPDQKIYLETRVGDVYAWTLSESDLSANVERLLDDSILGSALFRLPQLCQEVLVVEMSNSSVVLVSLARSSHQLYVNGRAVGSLYSSFCLHNDFLLVTSLLQTLRCVPLTATLEELVRSLQSNPTPPGQQQSSTQASGFNEEVRAIEPGARLICAVAKETKVVLQMPRGNLETIHPRALLLTCLRRMIDSAQYSCAMELMRRHRVNMNLVYDHSPSAFLDNLEVFVRAVNNADQLNLFLAQLIDEDLSRTMYARYYQRPAINTLATITTTKADRICGAMIEVLDNLDPKKYLLCILTCYAKKSTPELDKALLRVKTLKDAGDSNAWETSLRHLEYLVDISQLYRVALSTYDLTLAASIAERSQMDPKEYLPFLNKLKVIPCDHYRRYSIDHWLKLYQRALDNIVKSGKEHFEECLQLVKEQKLYSVAMDIYPQDSDEFKMIGKAFAHHLLVVEKSVSGAGLVHMRCGAYVEAADCFWRVHNWRLWLAAVTAAEMSADVIQKEAEDLAGKLKDLCRHGEAMTIYEEHLKDHDAAITTAMEGGLWNDALRLIYCNSRMDLINSGLAPALNQSTEALRERIDNAWSEFSLHLTRLCDLREKHQTDYDAALADNMEPSDLVEHADLFSDVSSVTGSSVVSLGRSSQYSSASKASGRSTKNRRKADRKKWTLKEGSPYEEVAIIEVLYKAVETGQNLADECKSLLEPLCHMGATQDARQLCKSVNKLLSLHQKSLTQIWDSHMTSTSAAGGDSCVGPLATTNSRVQFVQDGGGRKRYEFAEIFLRFAPKMPVIKISTPLL